jgi:hypothetical protein
MTGLFFTDVVENELGLTPSDEDRERLQKIMPTIRLVDRDSNDAVHARSGDESPYEGAFQK